MDLALALVEEDLDRATVQLPDVRQVGDDAVLALLDTRGECLLQFVVDLVVRQRSDGRDEGFDADTRREYLAIQLFGGSLPSPRPGRIT